MKQPTYIFIPLVLCCMIFAGCDKYLDVKPKGKQLLTTVADYDQWLNDDDLVYGYGTTYVYSNFFNDNADLPTISNPPNLVQEMIYTWQPQLSTDLSASPMFWGEHYSRINLYNTVLVGIDKATGGTLTQKKSLKAEALLGRALEYFYLVNEYGKQYDSVTATKDLAVPFVTSNDITQDVPPRSSVAEIYEHLISDLNAAIPDLPLDNSANRFRGSAASAYSLLARVYFYARNYAEARKNAELALSIGKAVMINYNGALPASNLLGTQQDVIFGRMSIGQVYPTLDFLRSFAANDLRIRKWYYSTDSYKFTTRGATLYCPPYLSTTLYYTNTGTSVQEMKLMIAECAARVNDLPTALQQLDDVRRSRYATASYVAFQSNNQEDVFQEVLKERAFELSFNGLRWFDMRRFDKENRMDTLYRYDAQGKVIATLAPHDNRYTLQIPVQVMAYHPEMPQNP